MARINPTITREAKFTTGTSSPIGTVTPLRIGHFFIDITNNLLFVATGTTPSDWVDVGNNALPTNINREPSFMVGSTQMTMDVATTDVHVRYLRSDVIHFEGRIKATAWTSTGNLSIADLLPENANRTTVIDGHFYKISGFSQAERIAMVSVRDSTSITLRNQDTHALITHAVLTASPSDIDAYVSGTINLN